MREVVIEQIASENHVPRFVAAWVYRLIAKRLSASAGAADTAAMPRGQ
jgi:hypothetical protein